MAQQQTRDASFVKLNDTYFRRLLIPLVITILVLAGFAVIILAAPGTAAPWPTSSFASQPLSLFKTLGSK